MKQKDLIKKYEIYIEKTIEIFKNILNHMNSKYNLMKLNNNIKLNNLVNKFGLSFQNVNIDDISKVINEEFQQIKNYIDNNNKKNSD